MADFSGEITAQAATQGNLGISGRYHEFSHMVLFSSFCSSKQPIPPEYLVNWSAKKSAPKPSTRNYKKQNPRPHMSGHQHAWAQKNSPAWSRPPPGQTGNPPSACVRPLRECRSPCFDLSPTVWLRGPSREACIKSDWLKLPCLQSVPEPTGRPVKRTRSLLVSAPVPARGTQPSVDVELRRERPGFHSPGGTRRRWRRATPSVPEPAVS